MPAVAMPSINLQVKFLLTVVTSDENPSMTAALTVLDLMTDTVLAAVVEEVAPFDSLDDVYAHLIEASRERQLLIW